MVDVNFTPKKRDDLRKAYNQAVEDNVTEFEFDGNTYYVAYAKYLLQHLDNVLVTTH